MYKLYTKSPLQHIWDKTGSRTNYR